MYVRVGNSGCGLGLGEKRNGKVSVSEMRER